MSRYWFRLVPLELWFWVGGITLLSLLDPTGPSIPSVCVYRFLGFDFCPGCGLGSSISFLLHGEGRQALNAHLLGPFALVVIVARVVVLSKNTLTIHRKEHSHA